MRKRRESGMRGARELGERDWGDIVEFAREWGERNWEERVGFEGRKSRVRKWEGGGRGWGERVEKD